MHAACTYHIALRGAVIANDLNVSSPLQVSIERFSGDSTWLSVHTDQSGLIGLLRHLHGLGFTVLGMSCDPTRTTAPLPNQSNLDGSNQF